MEAMKPRSWMKYFLFFWEGDAMALIAWYKLDGNANDTLGVFNGTPSNMTYTTGKFSQAGSFNGTSSGITCDINIAIKSFSM